MKKKLIIGLALIMTMALAIPAFAAASSQDKEISDLWSQIAQLRKQIVQKYVEAGKLSKDQGADVEKNIAQSEKYRQDNPDSVGPGYGCGGSTGSGMMNGNVNGMMGGAGYGMMGGWTNGTDTGTTVGQTI